MFRNEMVSKVVMVRRGNLNIACVVFAPGWRGRDAIDRHKVETNEEGHTTTTTLSSCPSVRTNLLSPSKFIPTVVANLCVEGLCVLPNQLDYISRC